MNDEVKKELKEEMKEPAVPKIIAGYIGKYVVSYENKGYSFEFPVDNKLEQNLAVLTYLKDQVLNAIIEQSKIEKKEVKEEEVKE